MSTTYLTIAQVCEVADLAAAELNNERVRVVVSRGARCELAITDLDYQGRGRTVSRGSIVLNPNGVWWPSRKTRRLEAAVLLAEEVTGPRMREYIRANAEAEATLADCAPRP